jgi:8-oxo-dGTP diphosphatase
MPEDKKQSNYDQNMDKLREAYELIHVIGVDGEEDDFDWKLTPEEEAEEDEKLRNEGEHDYTPGAYDAWINSDSDETYAEFSKKAQKADEKEDNEDNRFLVQKSNKNIKFSTKIVAFNNAGKFLIMADAYSDYWDLPGGHVEAGETPEDSLIREVREETSLEIHNVEAHMTTELVLGDEEIPVLFYMGEVIGEPLLSEEHTEFAWVTLDESTNYNLGVFHDVLEELFNTGHPGGIITFPIDQELAKSLDLGGYEKQIDNAHITLAYVKYNYISHEDWYKALNVVIQQLGPPPQMDGQISGPYIFDASENPKKLNVVVALVEIPGLKAWRADLIIKLEEEGFDLIPRKRINENYDFTPHITLEYFENKADIPQLVIPSQPITFPRMEIWANNEQYTLDFVNSDGTQGI